MSRVYCRAVKVLVVTGLVMFASASPAAAISDFGDAPDGGSGHFPSLARSHGPRHAKIGPLLLGRGESSESDSRQVDVDPLDDGFAAELEACKVSRVEFVVNAAGLPAGLRTAGHKAYLNAWFDWNRNGRWGGSAGCGGKAAPEWAVKNVAISLAGFARKPIQVVQVDVVAGPRTQDLWQRATLTLDQRAGQQGARGGRFRYGETEDYGPRQLVRAPPRGAGGNAVLPVPEDKPSAMCRAPLVGQRGFAPPGMPAFIEHGDFEALRVDVVRGHGGVETTLRAAQVFGAKPKGIQTALLPAGLRPWSVHRDVVVASTAVDTRENPLQLVIVPVDVQGTRVGKLRTYCIAIVAHEVLTPAGANTFQPGGSGTTIDTTVGPPVITGGGQTTDGSSPGSGYYVN